MLAAVIILSSVCFTLGVALIIMTVKYIQTEKALNLAVRSLLSSYKGKEAKVSDIEYTKVSFPSKDGF